MLLVYGAADTAADATSEEAARCAINDAFRLRDNCGSLEGAKRYMISIRTL